MHNLLLIKIINKLIFVFNMRCLHQILTGNTSLFLIDHVTSQVFNLYRFLHIHLIHNWINNSPVFNFHLFNSVCLRTGNKSLVSVFSIKTVIVAHRRVLNSYQLSVFKFRMLNIRIRGKQSTFYICCLPSLR